MKRFQKGFTLIELMIVVAIIGILAAIAIPSYQDYIVKAKLSKVSSAVDPLKLAIASYAQENGTYLTTAAVSETDGAGWTSLGLTGPATLITETAAIGVSASADGNVGSPINITLRNIKAGSVDGNIITMTPATLDTITSSMTWTNTCAAGTATSVGAIVKKYFNCN